MILVKLKHLFQRAGRVALELPKDIRDFGIKPSVHIAWNRLFLRPRSKAYIRAIYHYMDCFLQPVVKQYNSGRELPEVTPKKRIDKIPIWVCWFQGEEAMPELVKVCFAQLKNCVPREKAEVHLITLDNISEYITLSDNIWEKFRNGTIAYAFFSDILRYHLTRDYGGIWIDATIYVSDPIPEEWLRSAFYTMRMHAEKCPHEACEGRWTNFCFAGHQGNFVFRYVCDALEFYWEKKSRVPDYVFLDYILMVGYRNIPQLQEQFDAVPFNNEEVWALKDRLCDAFDLTLYQKITSANTFHKLAHQVEYPKKTADGRMTFYGKLYQQCQTECEIVNV